MLLMTHDKEMAKRLNDKVDEALKILPYAGSRLWHFLR